MQVVLEIGGTLGVLRTLSGEDRQQDTAGDGCGGCLGGDLAGVVVGAGLGWQVVVVGAKEQAQATVGTRQLLGDGLQISGEKATATGRPVAWCRLAPVANPSAISRRPRGMPPIRK